MDPNAKEILELVHMYYSTAWKQLITYTTALIALVGILIPILNQWHQRRLVRLERQELENIIKKYQDESRQDLMKTINDKMEKLNKTINDEILKNQKESSQKIRTVLGASLHIQGVSLLKAKNHSRAIKSFVEGADCMIDAEDEQNLQTVLRLIETCLGKVSKKDIENMWVDEDKIQILLTRLKEKNKKNRYSNYIRDLSKAYKSVMVQETE